MDWRDSLEQWVNEAVAQLLVMVGIVIIVQSWDLKYMAEYGPGLDLLPSWLGVGLILLGLVLLAQVTFSPKKQSPCRIQAHTRCGKWFW